MSYNNLLISMNSLSSQNTNILSYVNDNFSRLIFYPGIIEADIDIDNYCQLLKGIKEYEKQITPDQNADIIKEKLLQLSNIEKNDFLFKKLSLPFGLDFLAAPLGIAFFGARYISLSSLKDKLYDMNTKIGTLQFMLTAYTK